MLFGRREAPSLRERISVALWPRRSWLRSLRYLWLRLLRLDASPHRIALGVAIGVFASFQPFLGFQMLFAGAASWVLGASISAAMIGTFVGGPTTWPLMWLSSYHLGAALVGTGHSATLIELGGAIFGLGATASAASSAAAAEASAAVWRVLYPTAVGAVPIGLLCGAVFYAIVIRAARLRIR